MEPIDLLIQAGAGPEPVFDPVMQAFLSNSRDELLSRCRPDSLLEFACLGRQSPWLWRLTFRTRGLAMAAESDAPVVADRHVFALRILPDYLRRADRFEMLRLISPESAFHPNLAPPGVCVQITPGESLVEICHSLHALIGWRLRQLNESDALNPKACVWGRSNLAKLPIDSRPLFGGSALKLTFEPVSATP